MPYVNEIWSIYLVQNFFLDEAEVDEDDEDEEGEDVEEGWEQHNKTSRENEKGPSARDIENERRGADLDGVDEEQIAEYYK